jgi:hypothetical protein
MAEDRPPTVTHRVLDDVFVWIDSSDTVTAALDALIVERLSLALLIRLDSRRTTAPPRDLTLVVDRATTTDDRRAAGVRLGLISTDLYRVVVAPLFATWAQHPRGPEDVVATPFGPVHTSIVTAGTSAAATPLGIGSATGIDDLDRSFRTALIALRLHDGGMTGSSADDFGGLAEILADLPDDRREGGDQVGVELVMLHSWGAATVDALVRAGSVREAARLANVHHSTMTDRVEIIESTVKFDPMNGIGRTRLGLAYLQWRLRTSRVLEFTPSVERI